MTAGRLGSINPLNWPITVKVPMAVVVLMIVVSVVITNRVLTRLAETQERHLEQLASAYLDGLSASLILPVVREDIWEVFDTLDRARERYRGLSVRWTAVTNGSNRILAASEPARFPSQQPLADAITRLFPDKRDVVISDSLPTAFLSRSLTYQDREIGRIYAEADISQLLRERSEVLATLLLTNVILTILLTAAGYFVIRQMVRPIRVLSLHLGQSAQGTVEPINPAATGRLRGEFARLFERYNALARAVSEREELAGRLAEEEKLASLGRLASGLAHEINNPLGGMFNALDAIKRHGEREGVRATSIRLLEQGLSGIRDLVRSSLAVYRETGPPRSLVGSDIDDLRLLIGPEIKRRQLLLEWRNEIEVPISLPATPIRDAILNLLLNACAASSQGGTVGFRSGIDGTEVEFEVTDNGPGLPSHVRDYLESGDAGAAPQGKRSGLGLWMVKRLCHDLGGSLEAIDNGTTGTRIRLRLPLNGRELSRAA
jgi:signal transduction histidine kinase